MLGWKELLFIALAVVILFGGATQLPKIMRSLGEGLREFKKSVKDVKKSVDIDTDIDTDTDTDTNTNTDTSSSPKDSDDPAQQV